MVDFMKHIILKNDNMLRIIHGNSYYKKYIIIRYPHQRFMILGKWNLKELGFFFTFILY